MGDKLIRDLVIAENLARGNSPNASLLYRKARIEIEFLRMAVMRYGDRSRMATVEPMGLQQVIDRTFLIEAITPKEREA